MKVFRDISKHMSLQHFSDKLIGRAVVCSDVYRRPNEGVPIANTPLVERLS